MGCMRRRNIGEAKDRAAAPSTSAASPSPLPKSMCTSWAAAPTAGRPFRVPSLGDCGVGRSRWERSGGQHWGMNSSRMPKKKMRPPPSEDTRFSFVGGIESSNRRRFEFGPLAETVRRSSFVRQPQRFGFVRLARAFDMIDASASSPFHLINLFIRFIACALIQVGGRGYHYTFRVVDSIRVVGVKTKAGRKKARRKQQSRAERLDRR